MMQLLLGLAAGLVVGLVMEWMIDWSSFSVRRRDLQPAAKSTGSNGKSGTPRAADHEDMPSAASGQSGE